MFANNSWVLLFSLTQFFFQVKALGGQSKESWPFLGAHEEDIYARPTEEAEPLEP